MEETRAAEWNSSGWTFEQAMRRLEEIVRQLEAGDLPLDASIRAYEESMKLVKFCREQLDKAEFQLEKLGQELADESVSP